MNLESVFSSKYALMNNLFQASVLIQATACVALAVLVLSSLKLDLFCSARFFLAMVH